ncbi:MAG TPA: heavy-metal-associated domain-containing protein [Symbiobacteriaceae bacterium]|nr:heavy-metal-associated domain-containing protein [Symbiobacteriaceae bacterium]
MTKQMVLLANLTCPSCAGKLEKAVAGLPGMKSARVAFGTGALHVEYDEARLGEAEIRAAVRQQGLEVTMFLRGR